MGENMITLDGKGILYNISSKVSNPSLSPRTLGKKLAVSINDKDGFKTLFKRAISSSEPLIVVQNGFIVENLPDTPVSFIPIEDASWWKGACAALALLSIADLEVASYASENNGALFVNLVSIPAHGKKEPGELSKKSVSAMRGHTDAVAHPLPSEALLTGKSSSPDYVVLICLRNGDVPTKICSLSQIMGKLSENTIEQLTLNQFTVSPQKTFKSGDVDVLFNVPVLQLNPLAIRFSHSNVYVSGNNNEAENALDELKVAIKESMQEFTLKAGDIALINNRTAIHGRSSPIDEYGGQSRWLLRTYSMLATTPQFSVNSDIPHLLIP